MQCVCMCVCVLVAQACPTLCNPTDCNPPDSSVHGILQARILEWIAIPFSGVSSQPRDWTRVSCIASRFFTSEPPGKPIILYTWWLKPSLFNDKSMLLLFPQLCLGLSLVAQIVMNLPAMWETQVRSQGLEDPLEEETVTYSSILA